MKFFLDTASVDEIKKWQPYGLVHGATTNPTLLAKENNDPIEQLKKITLIVDGPVSAQITYDKHEKMIVQGKALAKLSDKIVVKIPATKEGFLAAKEFVKEGINCNVTLTFDPTQAILFCLLPTTYVSLIVGRVEDFGLQNINQISKLREMIDVIKSPTKLLAASIRNSHHLIAAILSKADIVTVPPSTWDNIYQNPQTLTGEKDFLNTWKTLPQSLREKYENLK